MKESVYTVSMPYSHLHRSCKQMVDTLLDNIAHEPGGYLWLCCLPKKGRHSKRVLQRRWAKLLYTTLIPATLQHAMLVACLTSNGQPDNRGFLLYKWLLHNIYNDDVKALYTDWLPTQHF